MKRDYPIQDLARRLPWKTKCRVIGENNQIYTIIGLDIPQRLVHLHRTGNSGESITKIIAIESIKPFLIPLEKMNEDQRKFLITISGASRFSLNGYFSEIDRMWLDSNLIAAIGFLDSEHFDSQGLIQDDLALDAIQEGGIYG